jgi:hypothetical protein
MLIREFLQIDLVKFHAGGFVQINNLTWGTRDGFKQKPGSISVCDLRCTCFESLVTG